MPSGAHCGHRAHFVPCAHCDRCAHYGHYGHHALCIMYLEWSFACKSEHAMVFLMVSWIFVHYRYWPALYLSIKLNVNAPSCWWFLFFFELMASLTASFEHAHDLQSASARLRFPWTLNRQSCTQATVSYSSVFGVLVCQCGNLRRPKSFEGFYTGFERVFLS